MKIFILIVLYTILLNSCSTQKFVETDLYFGLSKPNGTIIGDSTWNKFVVDYIGKIYSTGFTQIRSEGKWLDTSKNKLVEEPSRIIISIHKLTKDLSEKIDSVRLNYKKAFNQEAVLRVDKKIKKIAF